MLSDAQVNEFIEYAAGTCHSSHEILETLGLPEDLTREDWARINSEVVRCTTCSWWVYVDEAALSEHLEPVCRDCLGYDDF